MPQSLFSHPPPGLMGGQPGLPAQQPDLAVHAGGDAPTDEIARLHQELVAKKQAILRWEDGMKQAYNVSLAASFQSSIALIISEHRHPLYWLVPLRNDLYCVEWDVKLYYTIPYTDWLSLCSFSVLTLLIWWQEGHLKVKSTVLHERV